MAAGKSMQQKNTSSAELRAYLVNDNDLYAAEKAVIGSVIRELIASRKTVNNKGIILALAQALECSNDVVHLDVLRNSLEIVLGYTPED